MLGTLRQAILRDLMASNRPQVSIAPQSIDTARRQLMLGA